MKLILKLMWKCDGKILDYSVKKESQVRGRLADFKYYSKIYNYQDNVVLIQ